MVPCSFDYKFYEGLDLLDLIEEGFYDDYDPYDCLEISQLYPHLGPQECLDSLVDLGAGDFDVVDSSKVNHGRNGIIDVDGEFQIGNIGEGMQSAGTGCNGCTGCNIKLDKSKIKEQMSA